MRGSNWVSVVGVCLAVLALLVAYYCFSLGVLFESACHMRREGTCEALTHTLRQSLVAALIGVAIGGATAIRVVVRARRHRATDGH